jgi:hypothetical protein
MRLGLFGIHRSPDLCLLKKRIEDLGHDATFLNLRAVPEYTLSSLTPSSTRLDHLELLDFDCFYLSEFEIRNRFFRGSFGREIWTSLRDRYLEFARSECDSLAYQAGFLLSLGRMKPFLNTPEAFLRNRLRSSVLFRLSQSGLPATPFSVGPAGEPGGASTALRIRTEEDHAYDVPSFPRELKGCVGMMVKVSQEEWRIIALRGYQPSRLLTVQNGTSTATQTPGEISNLAEQVLSALDLELAEIRLARNAPGFDVFDVRPVPEISGFEEVTGEEISNVIAERLLFLGGSR